MRKLKFDCYNNITKVTKNNRAENLHFSKKCGLITTNCVFDKILTTKGSRIKHSRILVLNYANHREDKFLRTNNKHTENGKKQVTAKKTSRALKPISFIRAIILHLLACLFLPQHLRQVLMLMLTAERLHTPLAVLILSHSQLLKTVRKQYLRTLLTKKQRKPQRQPNRQKRLPSLQQLPQRRTKRKLRQLLSLLKKKKKKHSLQRVYRLIL